MNRFWTVEEKKLLRQLYLEENLPIAQIALRLGRTTASINTVLAKFGIPRTRCLPKFQFPNQMTPTLARIHAHVCGDGHLFVTRERDHYGYLSVYRQGYYRRRYGFGYTNLNSTLLQSFVSDVKNILGLTPHYNLKRWGVAFRSKPAWELLKILGAGKSREWKIHSDILQAPDPVKIAWVKAFFDDEAHFVPHGGIRVRSVNRPGLEQLASMLRQFIPCHLTPEHGLYPDDSCYLVVPKAARAHFLQLIGSTKFPSP